MSPCSICGSPAYPTALMSRFRSFGELKPSSEARICRYCFREIVPFKIISLSPIIVEWERFGKPGEYNTTIRLGYKEWRCSCEGSRHAPYVCYHISRLYNDEGMNRLPEGPWQAKATGFEVRHHVFEKGLPEEGGR